MALGLTMLGRLMSMMMRSVMRPQLNRSQRSLRLGWCQSA